MDKILINGPYFQKAHLCEPIIRALPEWFALEEAIQKYVKAIDGMPTFLAWQGEAAVGFLTVKVHYPQAAEFYVLGLLPGFHHQGLGRRLAKSAEDWLREQEIAYLQVKTLGPSRSSFEYERTRAFYLAIGFSPLEELTEIWDENNPCLIMVKKL